ncbi:hypothetical protein Tco_0223077 [Tanacetum coccineum]
MFDNNTHQWFYENLCTLLIHAGTIVDWSFFVQHAEEFFESINNDAFSGPQWVNLFQINEPVYKELVRGECKTMPLLELRWRVGLYSEEDSLDDHTGWNMQNALTIKIVMELDGGTCCWPVTRRIEEGDEVDEEGKGAAGAYRDMSQGDWQARQGQWMGQQDER